ncbi:hypothetical protein [Exiguobacterium undae]|uniref:hypothetical protein n=1 Tax=Exiguobacterium undae TaxID=169177 RepID=UPI000478D1C8|nr:hypothetical protein [Exiguobacterium undae]
MLLKEWEHIFKPNVVKKKSGKITVTEIDKQEKFEMELNLILKDTSTYYHLFIEHPGEKSRLTHCRVQNFPDVIIFEVDQNQNPIFHIIELKLSPGSVTNLKKISKQFLSGYVNILSSLYFLDFNKEKTPEFKYYVGYVNEVPLPDHEDTLEGIEAINLKVSPGEDLKKQHPKKLRTQNEAFKEWHKDTIVFDEFSMKYPETRRIFNNVEKMGFLVNDNVNDRREVNFSYYKYDFNMI